VQSLGVTNQLIPDLGGLLSTLATKKIYAIARLPVFWDQALTGAKPEWALKSKKAPGQPWLDHSGRRWANPYISEVWDYNIALAKEVAERGFDRAFLAFPFRHEGHEIRRRLVRIVHDVLHAVHRRLDARELVGPPVINGAGEPLVGRERGLIGVVARPLQAVRLGRLARRRAVLALAEDVDTRRDQALGCGLLLDRVKPRRGPDDLDGRTGMSRLRAKREGAQVCTREQNE